MDIAEMNIRAKYATNTAKGIDIDKALEGAAGDVSALDERVTDLETTVGDEDSGLVKAVSDLDTEKQDALTTESVPDGTIDDVIGFNDQGAIVKGTIEGGTKFTILTSTMTDAERKAALDTATLPYLIYVVDNEPYYYQSTNTSQGYHFLVGTTGTAQRMHSINMAKLKISDGSVSIKYMYFQSTMTDSLDDIAMNKSVKDYVDGKVKTLYRHEIYFRTGKKVNGVLTRAIQVMVTIINDSPTQFTDTTFQDYLYNHGANEGRLTAVGTYVRYTNDDTTAALILEQIMYINSAQLSSAGFNFTFGYFSNVGWFTYGETVTSGGGWTTPSVTDQVNAL